MSGSEPQQSATGPVLCGLAAFSAWVAAGTFVALSAILYQFGFDGLAFVAGPVAGLVLGGVLIAPALARSGATSIPDFMKIRFGSSAAIMARITIALCGLIIAVVGISSAGWLMAETFAVPFASCASFAAAASLILAFPSNGVTSIRWGALFGALILAGLLVPAFALTATLQGVAVPQIAYGEALARIGELERTLIGNGLASAQSLKPHTRPFLQIDAASFNALIICLMAGTAVLPQILERTITVGSARDTRSTAAWTALFVLIAVLTAPVYAALAKVHLYETIAGKLPLSALPDWMGELSRQGNLRIHGISVALFEAVSTAAATGAKDAASVANALAGETSAALAKEWSALTLPVQTLALDTARSLGTASSGSAFDVYRSTLMPAVAAISGNKPALLTLTALDVNAGALILSLPRALGLPPIISAVLIAGALAAALAISGAALDSIGQVAGRSAGARRVLLVIAAGLALAFTLVRHGETAGLAPASLSFAAAGMFPALFAGLWWRRANAWGAAAGMGAGLAIALFYTLGTHYAPVSFHTTWSGWSSAGPSALKKYDTLEKAWTTAPSDDARTAAWTALEAHAAGTPLIPGVANWLGIPAVASAVFALPIGFLIILLAGLIPQSRSGETEALIEQLRRPGETGITS